MTDSMPALLIGIVLALGAVQVSLNMGLRHASELGAFEAARVMEEGRSPAEAKEQVSKWCATVYPKKLTSLQPHVESDPPRATVRVKCDPILRLDRLPQGAGLGPMEFQAVHPPPLP